MTRRGLLKDGVKLVVIGSALPVLSACGGKKSFTCDDTSGLSTADKQLRTSLAYVDKSAHGEAKNCLNCQFYEGSETACGTCTLVKGPIHPLGYCNSWAPKT